MLNLHCFIVITADKNFFPNHFQILASIPVKLGSFVGRNLLKII